MKFIKAWLKNSAIIFAVLTVGVISLYILAGIDVLISYMFGGVSLGLIIAILVILFFGFLLALGDHKYG